MLFYITNPYLFYLIVAIELYLNYTYAFKDLKKTDIKVQ